MNKKTHYEDLEDVKKDIDVMMRMGIIQTNNDITVQITSKYGHLEVRDPSGYSCV